MGNEVCSCELETGRNGRFFGRKVEVRCEMIRIISKVKYQGKCDGCGIGITCEKGDVTNVQVGINELGNFVNCPICGAKIRVTEYMEQIQKGA